MVVIPNAHYITIILIRRRRRNKQAAKRIAARALMLEKTTKLELPVSQHHCERIQGASYCPHCGAKLV